LLYLAEQIGVQVHGGKTDRVALVLCARALLQQEHDHLLVVLLGGLVHGRCARSKADGAVASVAHEHLDHGEVVLIGTSVQHGCSSIRVLAFTTTEIINK